MRHLASDFAVALALLGSTAALAQEVKNGQRLSERWCADCHAIGTPTTRVGRTIPFAAIAEKPGMSAQMIASFLMLPHATMPNPPLRESDARDIAAFIMQMKK
jgi:mono/diheme cytochrome c family protein